MRVPTPTSAGKRHQVNLPMESWVRLKPPRRLVTKLKKRAGRNSSGKVTVRHRGGGEKRKLRQIDWRRKRNVPGRIVSIEYDPNRTANIVLVEYADGDKRYVLSPEGVKVGEVIMASEGAEVKVGNALPLRLIPVGTPIHNLELTEGKGGQLVRTAGQQAVIQAKENGWVTVLLPSKEQRLIRDSCYATIGQVSNVAWRTVRLGKAGRRRRMGWRPKVRGVAMHPAAHPHGGGEGRSGIGMRSPKSPWGKATLGKKTRRKKYSDRYIVKRR
ncbi:MAG: 50S ribosomal protein L2 [Candidatus Chisholmbacteria bacterium]|nr:50S ribosomal protein L2 [Candidatus Chisholmbacteria bacterium]